MGTFLLMSSIKNSVNVFNTKKYVIITNFEKLFSGRSGKECYKNNKK